MIKDLLLFLRIGFYSLCVPVVFKMRDFRDALRFFAPIKIKSDRDGHIYDRVIRFAEIITEHGFLMRKQKCLLRSILKVRYLRMYGYSAKIFIGVSENGDNLKSHAWVTVDNKCIDNKLYSNELRTCKSFREICSYDGISEIWYRND